MTNLSNLGVTEILDGLDNKAFSAEELIVEYIKILKTKNKHNAYIHFNEEKSLNLAKESDARRAKNNSLASIQSCSFLTVFLSLTTPSKLAKKDDLDLKSEIDSTSNSNSKYFF